MTSFYIAPFKSKRNNYTNIIICQNIFHLSRAQESSRRPSSALESVTSSAYSKSPPTGSP